MAATGAGVEMTLERAGTEMEIRRVSDMGIRRVSETGTKSGSETGIKRVSKTGIKRVSETGKILVKKTGKIFAISNTLSIPTYGRKNVENFGDKKGKILAQFWRCNVYGHKT